MNKKTLNHISLFVAAAIFILVAIMYFAGAGAAKLVAESIDSGVKTLVDNTDNDGGKVALFLSALGVGASVAIVFILRVLGIIHILGGLITGIQALVSKKADDNGKTGLSRGFTIWAIVRFIIYVAIHIVVMVFAGINIRSIILVIGLLVTTIISIYSMIMDSNNKRKIAKKAEGPMPVVHM